MDPGLEGAAGRNLGGSRLSAPDVHRLCNKEMRQKPVHTARYRHSSILSIDSTTAKMIGHESGMRQERTRRILVVGDRRRSLKTISFD